MDQKNRQELLKLLDLIYQQLRNSGAGEAVSLADGADIAEGSKSDTAAVNGTSSSSVVSLLKGIYILLNTEGTTLSSILTTLGSQATATKQDSLIGLIDPTAKYNIANTDTASTVQYFGFLDKDGNWYILKNDGAGTYTYCSGLAASSYATAWTGRIGLTYVTFDSAF